MDASEIIPENGGRKRGRKPGSLGFSTKHKIKKAKSLEYGRKRKQEKSKENELVTGMSKRTRGRVSKATTATSTASVLRDAPRRRGVLRQDEIDMCIRVITSLIYESRDLTNTIKTSNPLKRASAYTGISESKLREIWDQWSQTGRVTTAKKERNRESLISKEWFMPLRMVIRKIKIVTGKAVEVPDLVKWFKEVHGMTVTRYQVIYRLRKLGFSFGKTHKYCVHRESDAVTRKRRIFLKRRVELTKLIEQRNKEIIELTEENKSLVGPPKEIPQQMCFVYIDESYCNRLIAKLFLYFILILSNTMS